MRTTLSIDDDVVEAAKELARQRGISLGAAVSDLMRRGLRAGRPTRVGAGGFPVFDVPEDARPLTLEVVKAAEEAERLPSST